MYRYWPSVAPFCKLNGNEACQDEIIILFTQWMHQKAIIIQQILHSLPQGFRLHLAQGANLDLFLQLAPVKYLCI